MQATCWHDHADHRPQHDRTAVWPESVGHADQDVVLVAPGLYPGPSLLGEASGIAQQIDDHLADARATRIRNLDLTGSQDHLP